MIDPKTGLPIEVTPEPDQPVQPIQSPIESPVPKPEPTPQPQPEPVPQPQPTLQPQPPRSTEDQLQDLGISSPSKTSGGFLKFLFILALVIFIFIIAALALVYFKTNKSDNNSGSNFDTLKTSPTPVSGTCFLNDRNYQIGESFEAADGCNTCTCSAQDNIVCTEKECSPTPTKIATSSSTINTTPDKVVLTFYQDYIKKFPPTYKDSPYLTANFIKKLDQTYSEMTNGGVDAILFAQDTPTNFTAKVLTQNATSATVSLTESNGWSQTLTVKLVIINGEWKIDSITK